MSPIIRAPTSSYVALLQGSYCRPTPCPLVASHFLQRTDLRPVGCIYCSHKSPLKGDPPRGSRLSLTITRRSTLQVFFLFVIIFTLFPSREPLLHQTSLCLCELQFWNRSKFFLLGFVVLWNRSIGWSVGTLSFPELISLLPQPNKCFI